MGETLTPQGKMFGGLMIPLWVFIVFGIVVAAGLLILIIRDISREGD